MSSLFKAAYDAGVAQAAQQAQIPPPAQIPQMPTSQEFELARLLRALVATPPAGPDAESHSVAFGVRG